MSRSSQLRRTGGGVFPHHGAVKGDRQRAHGGTDLGHKLAAARAGGQVPHPDVPQTVTCRGEYFKIQSMPAATLLLSLTLTRNPYMGDGYS